MLLSQTRVDLDARGTSKNMVYYDEGEITVQSVECDHVIGRFTQSLTSLQFGSTSQIVIPNQDIIYEVFLTVELPAVVANQSLPRGWLYDLIDSVSYTWGQANVSNLRLSGKSIQQLNMLSCGTKEKASAMLIQGGEAFTAASTGRVVGTIVIPLPWSNIDSAVKKGFDTAILNNPIQLQIQLAPATRIYGGSGTRPTALTSAVVYLRQGVFADRSNSIKWDLQANPGLQYQFPFTHKYSPSPKYGLTIDGTTRAQVELMEFINSDLQSIIFSVHRTDLQNSVANSIPMPGISVELFDIQLLYNGQVVFNCPANSGRLISMLHTEGESGVVQDAFITAIGSNTSAIQSYIYIIPFGMLRGINFEGKFDNTSRYSSQTFQLSFVPQKVLSSHGTFTGELHTTYVYNAITSISQGVANIQFS